MTPSDRFYVYILRCGDGTLYTGYTTELTRRLKTHNAGRGAKYTRSRLPVCLIGHWRFETKRDALRIEYALKQLSRSEKARLVEAVPDSAELKRILLND